MRWKKAEGLTDNSFGDHTHSTVVIGARASEQCDAPSAVGREWTATLWLTSLWMDHYALNTES